MIISRADIAREVEEAFAACITPSTPPPTISADCEPNCTREDECITGSDDVPNECINSGCVSVRNPSVTVLNNGIGLVAYENFENSSVIKIQQFHTSLPGKILPNRKTNLGRLEHESKWTIVNIGEPRSAKLYFFDEDLPEHFINGVNQDPEPGSFSDSIAFSNGPLQNQCFSLLSIDPTGSDDIGKFVRFIVDTEQSLSNLFPSSDDVYNIQWFIVDAEDVNLIGQAVTATTTDGFESLISTSAITNLTNIEQGRKIVDGELQLPPHIHDGIQVPIAYPSIAAAAHQMNALENSHFVYLTYQALEDKKWNLYMRQLRLSEYSQKKQTSSTTAVVDTLENLGITSVIYRAFCVNDDCVALGDNFLLTRSVVFQLVLSDGREVLNNNLSPTDFVTNLCPGIADEDFPKNKVFVKLTHSVVADRCPTQFGFNDIFLNWEAGDVFTTSTSTKTAVELFGIVSNPGDSVIDLGESSLTAGGASITSSQVGVVYFEENNSNSPWSAIAGADFVGLKKFKGMDASEPIPITEFEEGHCTQSVVKVNSNNDLFVAYECSNDGLQQIHIIGTSIPSSSLPSGVFSPKNLDATLDYFYKPDDFIFRTKITAAGMNQLPDMHIDPNDAVHMSWQSNRDTRWEIYYANSVGSFLQERITNAEGKSLKPSIDSNGSGHIYITWHDNRFDNWEILMAHKDDPRVLTLAEQDPYMASVRNASFGYLHSTGTIPLSLTNNTDDLICLKDITVAFFEDRVFENKAFEIKSSVWPFAFNIPEAQDDRSVVSDDYPTLSITEWSITGDVWESPIFDTSLVGSSFDALKFVFNNITFSHAILTAGELDDLSDGVSKTVDIYTMTTGNKIFVSDLPIITSVATEARGRYKRISFLAQGGQDFDLLLNVEIHSLKTNRVCIPPKSTVAGELDLTPEVRVDSKGKQVIETPLPVGFMRNNTFFISISGEQENFGGIVVFPNQKRSVSCDSCTGSTEPWSSLSCSNSLKLTNSSLESEFYNVSFRFYADQSLRSLIAQFDTFGNLGDFTVEDNKPAQQEWTDIGYEIPVNTSRLITVWPMLSNTTGLICGVKYWVETRFCKVDRDSASACNRLNLASSIVKPWTCDCESARWDGRFENSPTNIRDSVRWISSGSGFSDTRVTESSADNFNPTIKIKSNFTGIILYETNREDMENNIFNIYGSAFSIFPAANMYATGAESIISPFDEIVIKSDIALCSDSGCEKIDRQNDNKCVSQDNPVLEGRNIAFDLDQYDNIFLAAEQPEDQSKCQEFTRDKQQKIIVHRCGINSQCLVFNREAAESVGEVPCNNTEMLGKIAPLPQDKIVRKIIRLVRINNDSVRYHITRNQKPVAVVDSCSVILDIVVEPEVVAVRIQNGSDVVSNWFPIDPEIGDFTLKIPWDLSVGSGLKHVNVQASTYQGLTAIFTTDVIADYANVDFGVKMYKTVTAGPPETGEDTVALDDAFFADENLLPALDGLPVAGVRNPTSISETGAKGEFIFVEIIPSKDYLDLFESNEERGNNTPTFDFIQQGDNDKFGIPTEFLETRQVFRGVVPIIKDNEGPHRDGLAFVIPHFKRDCSDALASEKTSIEYVKDEFNIIAMSSSVSDQQIGTPEDVFESERDNIGAIKHKIDLRTNEDPYFVFGDPNYRLKKDKE